MADPVDSLRVMIDDAVLDYFDVSIADGTHSIFLLSHRPVIGTPSVTDDGNVVSTSDYTVTDASGKIEFDTAPTAGHSIGVEYSSAMFTDAELTLFFTRDGLGTSYELAASAAWKAKAAKYVEEVNFSADGVEVQNSTKVRAALQMATIYKQASEDAVSGGTTALPYFGGIDKDDKKIDVEDNTVVEPAFKRRMHDNYNTTGPFEVFDE